MIHIQSISDANAQLDAPRHGVPCFAKNPNFDFAGASVIVLGNSPAIGKVDLSLLDKVTTFGVNRIFKAVTPNIYLFTDPPILAAEANNIKAFKGPILIWQNYERSFVHDMPNTRFFNLNTVKEHSKWVWPKEMRDHLIREGTTTAYCIQMAILGRAKAVGILGIDFSVPELVAAGKLDTHFYGNGPAVHSTGGGDWRFHEPFYSAIPDWAAKFGVKVFNLTPFPHTPINKAGWPKLSLEEFVTLYGRNNPNS